MILSGIIMRWELEKLVAMHPDLWTPALIKLDEAIAKYKAENPQQQNGALVTVDLDGWRYSQEILPEKKSKING